LVLKSSLLQALHETIKERGWKQVEAADQLGIDQAKVSKLLAGQMAGFSIERRSFVISGARDLSMDSTGSIEYVNLTASITNYHSEVLSVFK
jgi:predicted transcriptional regulator